MRASLAGRVLTDCPDWVRNTVWEVVESGGWEDRAKLK